MFSLILLVIAIVIGAYGVTIYNSLVTLKHAVSQSLSNIDVLLKQRNEELPKLVETCKQYMQHEQETLEGVIKARSSVTDAQSSGDIKELGKAESLLRGSLGKLFALAENYPDLKADTTFKHLQHRITSLENSIADRREFYNDSVNNNNVRIEQFPDVIVAKLFNFKAFDLLQFQKEELEDVSIKELFK